MKPLLITLGGPSGSGKSTVSQILSKKLSLSYINMGQVMRDKAKEMNFPTVEEFEVYVRTHPEIDKEIDLYQLNYAKSNPRVLLESRLSGWFCYNQGIPAFKIWLMAELDTRSQRLGNRDQISVIEAKNRIMKRDFGHKERFFELYNIDITDLSIYNLIIKTDDKTPEEIVALILYTLKQQNLID